MKNIVILISFVCLTLVTHAQTPVTAGYLDDFDGDFAKVLVNQQPQFLHRSGLVMVDKIETTDYYRIVVAVNHDAYGAINRQGKIIAPFKYDEIRLLGEQDNQRPERNYCLAVVKLNGKAGAVDSTGKTLCEPEYSEIAALTPRMFKVKKNGLWGWRDMKTGQLVQEPAYEAVSESYACKGAIEITQKGLTGLASEDGTVLTPPKYKYFRGWGEDNSDYFYYTSTTGKCGLMDKKGKEITPALYDDFGKGPNPGMIAVTQKGLTGFLLPSGVLKTPPQYTKTQSMGDIFIVWKGNKCGALDAAGMALVPIENDEIILVDNKGNYVYNNMVVAAPVAGTGNTKPVKEPADKGRYIMVRKGKMMGMYTATGSLLIPVEYEQVQIASYKEKPYITLTRNGKSGLADLSGKIILPLEFDGFSSGYRSAPFYTDDAAGEGRDNYVTVLQQEKMGLFSLSENKLIIPARYTSIQWQNEDLLELRNGEDTSLLVDKTGKLIRNLSGHGSVSVVSPGRMVEKLYPASGPVTYLIDMAGNKLYEDRHWDFSPGMRNVLLMPEALKNTPVQFRDGLLKVRGHGRDNLFIDSMGKPVQFDAYSFVSDFYNGFAVAGKEDAQHKTTYGIINLKKEEVYPVSLDDISTFKDDLVLVKKNGAQGLLRKDGSVFLPLIYEDIDKLYDADFYIVSQNKKKGVLNSAGKQVLPLEYDEISYDKSTRLFTLTKDKKTGIADVNGKVIIPVVYDELNKNRGWTGDPFPLFVKKGEWYFYLDREGKELPIRSKKEKGYN